MGFKDKMQSFYAKNYMDKYGDRLTQIQGNVVSVKIEEKSILWIFHKLLVTLIIKPDRSKNVIKCAYKKHKWFKKPAFMSISQGHLLLVQGLKGKKGKKGKVTSDVIEVINIRNMTTKKDLVVVEGAPTKPVKQIRKYR